jgi:hypothetical protein
MRKSPFWRVVAVLGVAGLLYVGHGLHNGGNDGLPSIGNVARAGGVSVSTSNGAHNIYTASEDGRILFLWSNSGDGKLKFIAQAGTSDLPIERREAAERRPAEFNQPANVPHSDFNPPPTFDTVPPPRPKRKSPQLSEPPTSPSVTPGTPLEAPFGQGAKTS